MKTTISKRFEEIPFAHRQPKHDGHCALIHGHNWTIEMEIAQGEHGLDENGFIADFGKMKVLKDWIESNLDHAIVLCEDDSFLEVVAQHPWYFKALVVPSASAEGLAKYVFDAWNPLIAAMPGSPRLVSIKIEENSRNFATYRNE